MNEDVNIIPFEVLSGLKIRVWNKEGCGGLEAIVLTDIREAGKDSFQADFKSRHTPFPSHIHAKFTFTSW